MLSTNHVLAYIRMARPMPQKSTLPNNIQVARINGVGDNIDADIH